MRVSRAASTVLWLLGEKERGTSMLELCHEVCHEVFALHMPQWNTEKVAATTKWNDISHASRRIPRILTHPTHPDVSHVSHVSHASLPCRALQPQPKCFQRGGPVGLKQTPHRPMGGGGAGSVQFDRGHRHVSFPQRQGVEPVCFGKKVFCKKSVLDKKCFGKKSVLDKQVFWKKKYFGQKSVLEIKLVQV